MADDDAPRSWTMAGIHTAVTVKGGVLVGDDGRAEAFGFTLEACTSKSYEYSPAVDALEKEVRARKATERKDGTAQITKATGYVRVSEAKPVETFDGLPTEKNTAPAGDLPF